MPEAVYAQPWVQAEYVCTLVATEYACIFCSKVGPARSRHAFRNSAARQDIFPQAQLQPHRMDQPMAPGMRHVALEQGRCGCVRVQV